MFRQLFHRFCGSTWGNHLTERTPANAQKNLNQLAECFIEERELEGASPATLRLYRMTFTQLDRSGLDLPHFNSPDLLGMFAASLPFTWSDSTARAHLTRLATFANWLARNHHTNCRHRAPKQSRRPMHRDLPTAEETRRILSSLSERAASASAGRARTREQDALIVRVLYETGTRISEALALNVDDVKRSERGAWLYIRDGKTDAAERACPISDELAEELRRFRVKHHIFRGRIFRSRTGRPLNGGEFCKWLKAHCQAIGVSVPVTPHTFRYAFIIGLIQTGKSAIEVMSRIGHSDIEMTVYYFNQVRRLMPWVEVNGDVAILEKRRRFAREKFGKER